VLQKLGGRGKEWITVVQDSNKFRFLQTRKCMSMFDNMLEIS